MIQCTLLGTQCLMEDKYSCEGIRLGGSATQKLRNEPLVGFGLLWRRLVVNVTDGEAPHQDVGEILVDDAGAGSKIN